MTKTIRTLIVLAAIGIAVVWVFHRPAKPQTALSQPAHGTDHVSPTLSLAAAPLNLVATTGSFKASVSAADNLQVTKVEYQVDGNFAAVSYASPFEVTIHVSTLAPGEHKLRAIAYDAAGNASAPSIRSFTIGAAVNPPATTALVTPTAGSTKTAAMTATMATAAPEGASNKTSVTLPGTPVDMTAPTIPSSIMLSQSGEHSVDITWQAASDDTAVTSYMVFRDGVQIATTASLHYTDTTAFPGATYGYQLRAADASGNLSAASNGITITLAEISIFSSADTLPTTPANDSGSIELGVHIRPTHSGYITGVRFYKFAADSGTHIGTLWSIGGAKLAEVTFSGETTSGWQTAHFATPVAVTAGTNYIASYLAPAGNYAATANMMSRSQFTSPYLIAPADGEDGSNGLYKYSGSVVMPDQNFNATNYWVDALYTPSAVIAAPVARSCPAYPAFPNGACSGVIPGSTFLPYTGTLSITHDNTSLYNLDITGPVKIMANNVTLVNCKIHDNTGGVAVVSGSVTITDSELYNSQDQSIGGANWTATRVNIHNMTEDGVKLGSGSTLQDSWMHDFTPSVGAHADGGQMQNGVSNLLVRHNNIDLPGENSALFFAPDLGPNGSGPVVVDKNLLGGGNFSVYFYDGNSGQYHQSGYTVTNNRFLRDSQYSVYAVNEPSANFTLWTNNVWDDDGSAIAGP